MVTRFVRFFGDDRYKKMRWRLLLGILVVIVVADLLVARHHVEYFWEAIPGWSAVFGFASCVAIIFVSKFIGHSGGIMRDEDYYD